MMFLKSVQNASMEASLHPVLECAARIVGLTKTGQLDASRRLGEGSLTTVLSTSRRTVRSALDHLEISGLVKRVPRAGTYLTSVGPREFCQVMDIRAALESLCARQAAIRARPSDVEALATGAAVVDALNQRILDGDRSAYAEVSEEDLAFHSAIARLSGNPSLVSTLAQQRLIEQSYCLMNELAVMRPQHDRPVPTHAEVVEAIASRDPARADLVMRRHILRTKELRLGTITGEIA